MRTRLTVTQRGTIASPAKRRRRTATVPVEIYSKRRIAEFDAAEEELRKVLRRRRLESRYD